MLGSDSAFRYEKIYLHSVFGIALVIFREEKEAMSRCPQHLGDNILNNHPPVELKFVRQDLCIKIFRNYVILFERMA